MNDIWIDIKGKRYNLKEHTPLLRPEWAEMIMRLKDHPSAPYWNSHYGDRLTGGDLAVVNAFNDELCKFRSPSQYINRLPSDYILKKLRKLIPLVPAFRKSLDDRTEIEQDWYKLPFMSREDIARRPGLFVPDDADIKRIVIFATAGTTGHALKVPQHPSGACSYEPMLDLVFRNYGLSPEWGPGMAATILVGSQAYTVTCATVMTSWGGAGFAKINLKPSEWPSPDAPQKYFGAMNPFFLNGDPISLADMLDMGIFMRPRAILSTAVAMTTGLRKRLEEFYMCPVIDWYSSNETGPIGYTCRENNGFHILPHDIYAEIIGPDGNPLGNGEYGEIVITGGRNPFLPMLRYRTGDFGCIDITACRCGDPMPRIAGFEGRMPVLFKRDDGGRVNPVDISQALKRFSYVQHRLTQREDLSCELEIKPVSMKDLPDEGAIREVIQKILGMVKVEIFFDTELGSDAQGGKVIPYRSGFMLEP